MAFRFEYNREKTLTDVGIYLLSFNPAFHSLQNRSFVEESVHPN